MLINRFSTGSNTLNLRHSGVLVTGVIQTVSKTGVPINEQLTNIIPPSVRQNYPYNPGYNNYNDSNYQQQYDGNSQQQYDQYGQTVVDEFGRVVNKDSRYLPGQPNQLEQPDWWYDQQKVVTRMFNFVSIHLFPCTHFNCHLSLSFVSV